MNFLNWMAVSGFLPHGYCFQWSPALLSLMVASDAITAIAYYSIPLALLVFLDKRRKDVKMSWVFILFAIFIFACGTTHIVDIITIWYPVYWLQGVVKALTALASIATAVLIWPIALRASSILLPRDQSTEVLALQAEVAALKLQLAAEKS